SEAARFTPGLRVRIHHGPRRAEAAQLPILASVADVVLTTYATAVRDIEPLSKIGWRRIIVDEAQAIKNYQSETAQALRRLPQRSRLAMTGTPVENGLGDLWAILDFTNPGLVGPRTAFIEHLSASSAGEPSGGANGSASAGTAALVSGRPGEDNGRVTSAAEPTAAQRAVAVGQGRAEENALRALNGLLVFRRTKLEPEIAAELPDKVDKLDNCAMTAEQIGLYQAVVDRLVAGGLDDDVNARKGQILAAITALKQICDHPAAYLGEDHDVGLAGRSGKLARLEEIVAEVFAAGEKVLIFTHFARWGERLAAYLSSLTEEPVRCYHGGLSRMARDEMVAGFQNRPGAGALVLSIKAGGSGLNLTAANHVVLYDRWWNPAVEDQARDRAWRIGQTQSVVSHRLVCPGTVDERVEEIVAGKRRVAGLVLPARSSLGDLDASQIRVALGLKTDELIEDEPSSDSAVVAA
ncbi:MAG: DEAD/DEAH box helicase, partial [Acidimicrobiaceae bacterium]|nr:DEAD/DEAH box helicase [Acidimicrobiaceae bacterium]